MLLTQLVRPGCRMIWRGSIKKLKGKSIYYMMDLYTFWPAKGLTVSIDINEICVIIKIGCFKFLLNYI